MKIKFIIPLLILIFISISCAKRGTPDGGPIDEAPPEVIKTVPENNSVFFNTVPLLSITAEIPLFDTRIIGLLNSAALILVK